MAIRKYSKNTILAATNLAVRLSKAKLYLALSELKTSCTSDELLDLVHLSLGTKENLYAALYLETKEIKLLLYFNWILNDFDRTFQMINGTHIISDAENEKAKKLISIFEFKFLRCKDNLEPFNIFKDLDKFLLGIIELFYTITKLTISGSHDFYRNQPTFNSEGIALINNLLAKDLNSIIMKDLCKDLTASLL